MSQSDVTFSLLSESLLNDMIQNIIKNQILNQYSNNLTIEKSITENKEIDNLIKNYNFQTLDMNKDIFGQDKIKLKTSEISRYFECENCNRKIAGGRFAQHINKCLDRKRK